MLVNLEVHNTHTHTISIKIYQANNRDSQYINFRSNTHTHTISISHSISKNDTNLNARKLRTNTQHKFNQMIQHKQLLEKQYKLKCS